jgi:large subunit ribosomal protein L8e
MGKVILVCRKGKGSVYRSHVTKRIGAVKLRVLDFAEREGYVKGVIKEVRLLSPSTCAPPSQLEYPHAPPSKWSRRFADLLIL